MTQSMATIIIANKMLLLSASDIICWFVRAGSESEPDS